MFGYYYTLLQQDSFYVLYIFSVTLLQILWKLLRVQLFIQDSHI